LRPEPPEAAAPILPRLVAPPRRGHPRIFAVASGKGGTGKSLIAVNLAVAMADRTKVCLIDADFGLGNAHILLGLLPRYNVSHLIRGRRSLDEVLQEGPRGVLLLPGASGVPEMASLDDGTLDALASTMGPVLDRCDAVVLDCPAGLTRQSLLLLHGSDVVLVVTTEDLTSMTDAYALIKTLVTHRPDLTVGLVVNEARSPEEGAETYRKICHVSRKFLGREILSLGTIPSDAQLERSVTERRPAVLGHPRSPAARAIGELAARLEALQGIGTPLGFPERMHRTLSAAGAAASHGRQGDGLCMS
ncbi:MAG TPA: MinD/ParA family protein, partial [Candidatus Saccharimonadales bacterium]|nr:MinD/ParA family protein [Candidatus Saccharimonadales bacterium]